MGKKEENIRKVLSYDSLAEAERISKKRQIMSVNKDTYYGMEISEYEDVVQDIGFRELKRWHFRYEDKDAYMAVWWHDFGILLKYDTFPLKHSHDVNGGDFYYNWIPEGQDEIFQHTSSGGMGADGVWSGYHDARAAIRFHVHDLLSHGRYVVPWTHNPLNSITFMHYGDKPKHTGSWTTEEDVAMTAISKARFMELPEDIRKLMIPEGNHEL